MQPDKHYHVFDIFSIYSLFKKIKWVRDILHIFVRHKTLITGIYKFIHKSQSLYLPYACAHPPTKTDWEEGQKKETRNSENVMWGHSFFSWVKEKSSSRQVYTVRISSNELIVNLSDWKQYIVLFLTLNTTPNSTFLPYYIHNEVVIRTSTFSYMTHTRLSSRNFRWNRSFFQVFPFWSYFFCRSLRDTALVHLCSNLLPYTMFTLYCYDIL